MTAGNRNGARVFVLLPSLRISGGVKEAIRLAEDLSKSGTSLELVVLWKSNHELPCVNVPVRYLSGFVAKRSVAALQFPLLLIRFFLLMKKCRSLNLGEMSLVLTHFSTFPFAWTARGLNWYCFNQDVEWMFVKPGLRRVFLRWFILTTSRRSRVVTTNAFVEGLYLHEGIRAVGRLSIWSPKTWLTNSLRTVRDIDVVMLLRRGHMKRLDLYVEMLAWMNQSGFASCVITPDADIYNKVGRLATKTFLRPSDEELLGVYQRSKVFLLLSDTEGFGLPPLEAMGSGCVPLCRDSGGPQCYLTGLLATNLIPLTASGAEVFEILQALLSDARRLSTLSEYATEVFATGLIASNTERHECVVALTEALQTEV